MSVGQVIDKSTLDTQVSSFPKQLAAIFNQIQLFAVRVDNISDATLQAAPYNYTVGETAALRNAYRDLKKLSQVAQGLFFVASGATVNSGAPTANGAGAFGYNFFINTQSLDGTGY